MRQMCQPPTAKAQGLHSRRVIWGLFFLLNINKCLQLFQDCYVLFQYTQILSLQVKTVLPKLFPLGTNKQILPRYKGCSGLWWG